MPTTTLSTVAAAAAKVHPVDSKSSDAARVAPTVRLVEAADEPAKSNVVQKETAVHTQKGTAAHELDALKAASDSESVEEKEDVESDGTEEGIDREAATQHRLTVRGSVLQDVELWEVLDIDSSQCVSLRDLAQIFFMTGLGIAMKRKACFRMLQ